MPGDYSGNQSSIKPGNTGGDRNPGNGREAHVRIVYNRPTSIEMQPIGYNKEDYMHRVNALVDMQFSTGIRPELSHRIHSEQFVRSGTYTYGTNSNIYHWDPAIELANVPTSSDPTKVQQQYVQVPINATRMSQIAQSLRRIAGNKPTAQGNDVVTARFPNAPLIMSVPKGNWSSTVNQARQGSNFFTWIVQTLTGPPKG